MCLGEAFLEYQRLTIGLDGLVGAIAVFEQNPEIVPVERDGLEIEGSPVVGLGLGKAAALVEEPPEVVVGVREIWPRSHGPTIGRHRELDIDGFEREPPSQVLDPTRRTTAGKAPTQTREPHDRHRIAAV